MMAWLERWNRVRLELGTMLTGLLLLHRALQRLSGGHAALVPYGLFAQPLGTCGLSVVKPDPNTTTHQSSAAEIARQAWPRAPEVLAERWREGAHCYVTTVKEEFAGCIWISTVRHAEDEVACDYLIPFDSVWDFDVYVAPRWRLGRTFARMWRAVDEDLTRQGFRWSLSRISLFNRGSITAHTRMGARRIGSAYFLRLGPVQFGWHLGRPSLALGQIGRPALRLTTPFEQGAPSMELAPPAQEAQPRDSGLLAEVVPLQTERVNRHPAPRSPAALVLGVDSHGLAVVRALAQSGVATYAVEKDLHNPGLQSRYLRGWFPVNSYEASHLEQELPRIRAKLAAHDEVVLLAINDRQVEALASLHAKLKPAFRIAWSEQAATVLHLQRKDQLEARCRAQGLNYPRSQVFVCPDDAGLASGFRFPMIIKPVRPLSSFKTHMARDAAELKRLLDRYQADLPILGQEYIEGGDECIYFGALTLDKGRVVQSLTGRKLASYPPARGQTIIAETVHAPEVLVATERFFDGLSLSGPVSLELKQAPDGSFWVIEPTLGRTDFWAGLCIGAGFNQPLQEFALALGSGPQAGQPLRACVWYDSERAPLAYLGLAWRSRSLRPRRAHQYFCYAGHGDPKPFWCASLQMLSATVRRGLAKLLPRGQ